MDIIKIRDLTKKYGALVAVNRINLSIKKGEIFGLLGPNGAGKSRLLGQLGTLCAKHSSDHRIHNLTCNLVGYELEALKNPTGSDALEWNARAAEPRSTTMRLNALTAKRRWHGMLEQGRHSRCLQPRRTH